MSKMSYFDIARKSYDFIDEQFNTALEAKWFNPFAAECALIIERMIKGILVLSKLPEDTSPHIFETHSMQTLTHALHACHPNTIRPQDAAWLGDFYFDTRYPGDDFIVVSEYDARAILEITKTMANSLIDLHSSLVKTAETNFFGGI